MKLLTLVLVVSATLLRAQDPKEIIDRYLDTVSNGDIRNWDKITSLYRESEVYYSQADFDGKLNLSRPDKANFHKSFQLFPYPQKNEIYEDSAFTHRLSTFYFLKDRTIILLGNVPPMIKTAPSRDKYASDHLPVQIWKLAEKSKSIELLGVKEFPSDGLSCYEIRMTSDGRNYVLYINTDTFLLEYWNGREDEDISFLAKYYDYKRVDGFLIPMSSGLTRNGVVYFSTRTMKYIINADIDPEIFEYKEEK